MNLLWHRFATYLICFSALLTWSKALAWGSIGHALIGRIAADQAPLANRFWKANSSSLGGLSNVPDAYWKRAGTVVKEQSNHWFQFDGYMDPSQFVPDLFLGYENIVQQYSKAHVTENGTSSWRSEQMYEMAVSAFKQKKFKEGLEISGALSHYIADMSQPLHLTRNYDGEMSGQKGVHKYFETTLVQKANQNLLESRVVERVKILLNDANFRLQLDGHTELKISYLEGLRAVNKLEEVLRNDKETGRNEKGSEKQLEIIIERMADGAATLAFLFARIAQEAGIPDNGALVKTAIPVWIPSEFQGVPGFEQGEAILSDCL